MRGDSLNITDIDAELGKIIFDTVLHLFFFYKQQQMFSQHVSPNVNLIVD